MKQWAILLNQHRGDLFVLSAKWASPLVSLVAGLLTARFLTPDTLGMVQSVMLIQLYGSFLHLGVFNGLNRNLPLYIARGDAERVQQFISASSCTARLVGLLGALVAALAAGIFYVRGDSLLYVHLCLILMPGMYLSPRRIHLNTLYRGTQSFQRLGISMHIQNVYNILLAALTQVGGVYAAAIRSMWMPLFGLGYLLYRPPVTEAARPRYQEVKLLAKIGSPILFSSMIFTWLMAADRTIIAMHLPREALGYFALATITMNAMRALCTPVNELLYPRVAHCFGEWGSSRFLRRYVWIGLLLNGVLLAPVVGIGWFLLPYLVERFLPAYVEGIPAARISLAGSLAFIYSGPSVIIPVLRKNLPYQMAGLVTVGTIWAGGIWAVAQGYGIEVIAWVRALAMAGFCLFVILYLLYLTRSDILWDPSREE